MYIVVANCLGAFRVGANKNHVLKQSQWYLLTSHFIRAPFCLASRLDIACYGWGQFHPSCLWRQSAPSQIGFLFAGQWGWNGSVEKHASISWTWWGLQGGISCQACSAGVEICEQEWQPTLQQSQLKPSHHELGVNMRCWFCGKQLPKLPGRWGCLFSSRVFGSIICLSVTPTKWVLREYPTAWQLQ